METTPVSSLKAYLPNEGFEVFDGDGDDLDEKVVGENFVEDLE